MTDRDDSTLAPTEQRLYERVAQIIETARRQVARSVNTAMVHAYWLVGREIVEVEQRGKARAEYGERLVRRLAERLTKRFGKGFSYASVKRMKQFYLTFPNGSAIPEDVGRYKKGSTVLSLFPAQTEGGKKGSTALSRLPAETATGGKGSTALRQSAGSVPVLFPPLLSWSHYLVLMRVENPEARAFYEIEAVREGWSTRELERQVASLLYERLARSRDKDEVRALARAGQTVTEPRDVIKDPFVLEFLDLEERAHWLERDLEQAIIDRLEAFLLELGKGFCFVARQKRITLEGDHFYVDLVFYNRLLRCFVLIDLKLGKLTHQDLGQMQMYVHYFDRFERAEWEAPTVGIVLCSDKNDAMVRITLPEDEAQVHAARYQLYLPTEEELRRELIEQRERIERRRKLEGGEREPTDGA